jgi:putative ABC transport system permease protein
MKFLPLLLANLFRKKIRTTLTIGSFFVALALFALLAALRAGFNQGVDVAGADRLVVLGRTGLIQPLPMPYYPRLKRIPGVKDVTHATWFGGIYKDDASNFFPQFAVDPDSWLAMYPEYIVDPAQWSAFKEDRQGVMIGRKLAERFDWKIGDRIPLKSPGYFGGNRWEFNIRGIYKGSRRQDDETQFWMQRDYLYENGPEYWKGLVGWYVVRAVDPEAAAAVMKSIDAEFANSTAETRTQTESAFAAGFAKQMGNIEFLIRIIGFIVFFTLLTVTGNTMAISVRERTSELGVLKALGYSDLFVLGLVLAESLLIAGVGGGLGLLAGYFITGTDITKGLILLYLPPSAIAAGAAAAFATGILSGLLPALSAMRLTVVNALRRV